MYVIIYIYILYQYQCCISTSLIPPDILSVCSPQERQHPRNGTSRAARCPNLPQSQNDPKRFVWNILDSFLFGQYQHDKKLKSTAQQLVLEATSNAWSKWVFQPRSSLWCLMISRQSQYLWTWMFHWSFNAILFFFQCSSASYHAISMLC